jgi:thymidylate kinase
VVICDRYILDSKVQLRYDYGESRRFAFQMWLIRLLSPKADRSFLLDVSPETASARKADYDLSENARRARLYAEESSRLGVRRVDAERPRCEVCAELAADVWSALEKRESRAVPLRREHHNRNPPRQSARSDPSTAC